MFAKAAIAPNILFFFSAFAVAPSCDAQAQSTVVCSVSGCSPVTSFAGAANESIPAGVEWSAKQIWSYVDDILQVVGLERNFELLETSKVANAAAVIIDKKRVLAYNPDWLNRISTTDKWGMYGLLCHELGHHLQGHTLAESGSTPPIELQADRYAGFVLAKLGATESQALSLWQTLPSSASLTHPGREQRLGRVREGWLAGGGQNVVSGPTVQKVDEYILEQSSRMRLGGRELDQLPIEVLRLARNEIFARSGYIFESDDLKTYFSGRSWYRPRVRDVNLTEVEKYNVNFIDKREKALGGEARAVGFLLPQSSVQLLTASEIERLPKDRRRIARNEIFARSGFIFNDPSLDAHFRRMPWYVPSRRDVSLNAIERQNVALIRLYE